MHRQTYIEFVGLDVFATTCSTMLGIMIVTLVTWAYARYSGSLREVATSIDDVAAWLWENVPLPCLLPCPG